MVATVLLYVGAVHVGAVLFLNGIWLIGQTSEPSALKISNKKIAVINVFTGALGFLVAIYAICLGGARNDIEFVALGGYILLFAFTYLWVAINQYTEADGRALGWYSLFVALTAVPTGVVVLADADGHPWLVWLGIDWLGWAGLWFLFFLLLALQRPITRFTGFVTALEGIFSAWLPAWLLFQGYLKM
jgi:putative amide transporter protein